MVKKGCKYYRVMVDAELPRRDWLIAVEVTSVDRRGVFLRDVETPWRTGTCTTPDALRKRYRAQEGAAWRATLPEIRRELAELREGTSIYSGTGLETPVKCRLEAAERWICKNFLETLENK